LGNESADFKALPTLLRDALLAIFEIHRAVPGNAAVELLLLNHLHVVRWLVAQWRRANSHREELWTIWLGKDLASRWKAAAISLPQTLSAQEDDYQRLFAVVLRAYFLDPAASEPAGATEADGSSAPSGDRILTPEQALLLRELIDWIGKKLLAPDQQEGLAEAGSERASSDAADDRQMLLQVARRLTANQQLWSSSRFHQDVDRRLHAAAPSAAAGDLADDPTVWAVASELAELQPALRSFLQYFLYAGIEPVLERNLKAMNADDPRRAGDTSDSFVWVCPDFGSLRDSLPRDSRIEAARIEAPRQTDVERSASATALDDSDPAAFRRQIRRINRAYRAFFRHHEVAILADHYRDVSLYWRNRGAANRKPHVFTSFTNEYHRLGLDSPEADRARPIVTGPDDELRDPSPQSIFLRVRICDSLNEPFINGLFVFTSDHDEVRLKGKKETARAEDVEDILAFAKVFFFIVRDHVHGIDRARDASDIGRLNQHLYDRRLADLDRRMQRRASTKAFQAREITHRENWSLFSYEVLNNYACSLIQKPDDVRAETFQFDRVLIVPLPEPRRGARPAATRTNPSDPAAAEKPQAAEFELPFAVFQTIYTEAVDGAVQGGHFSLVKPFQSPVEDIDAKSAARFRARSFQKTSEAGGRTRRLERFLEKHYVGARAQSEEERVESRSRDDVESDRNPDSYCVKASGADWGREWSETAARRFWESAETADQRIRLWIPFLRDLTEAWRSLRDDDLPTEVVRSEQPWFLLRFSLLAAVLGQVPDGDPGFAAIREEYLQRELKLRFDNRPELNVLDMASGRAAPGAGKIDEPFAVLSERNRRKSLPEDPLRDVEFVSHVLRNQDPWTLAFLERLTLQIRGERKKDKEKDNANVWEYPRVEFQPTLTRPVEEFNRTSARSGEESAAPAVRSTVCDRIGGRVPQYERVREGDDALPMFIGVVNLTVGQSEAERRRLRCVVMLCRDFDHTRIGRRQNDEEAKRQLDVDRRDLTLYSRTFFQNVHRFLTTARERQQVRILSTDITQIARNWYARGVDEVDGAVKAELRDYLRNAVQEPVLDRLRPETVETLFMAIVGRVLLREERRRNQRVIELESFPFDRVMHVPLAGGKSESAVLSYVRTALRGEQDPAAPERWLAVDDYGQIRARGRHATLGSGRKILASDSPKHLRALGDANVPGRDARNGRPGTGAIDPVLSTLRKVAERDDLVDPFIRRLYHGRPLQTLAIVGLCVHALSLGRGNTSSNGAANSGRLDSLADRLRTVLEDTIRGIESGAGGDVLTDVYMDREVRLSPCETDGAAAAINLDVLRSTDRLPLFREFFKGVEPGSFLYGLGDGSAADQAKGPSSDSVRSKMFYVYYSLAAPEEFFDRLELGPRYRGLLCLLVDDASTDAKGDDRAAGTEFSVAEEADQEDVRTFLHNTMGRFRLILDSQALMGRLRKPGVDQFVNGMLHRLKNDLNEPQKALHALEQAVRTPALVDREQQGLLEQIDVARSTMTGIEDLFQQLKGFGDEQRGVVPLQSFSTDWIGWQFLRSICTAVVKQVPAVAGGPAAGESLRKEADKLRQGAESELRRTESDSAAAAAQVRRRLARLETLMTEYCRESATGGGDVEFHLSFDVFSRDRLFVRGSHHLAEALNILAENAFEAMWKHVEEGVASSAAENGRKRIARLRLVCRPSDEVPDEVLLEFENSSLPLKFKDVLNADVPQPVSARQYHGSSGKRKGGSGFGHYHARRTVRELCGGRAERRQLDVSISGVGSDSVCVRVNLLAPRQTAGKAVPGRGLLQEAVKSFDGASDGLVRQLRDEIDRLPADSRYALPGDVEPAWLFDAARRMLLADRNRKIDSLVGEARGACSTVVFAVDEVVAELRSLITLAASAPEPAPAAGEVARELSGVRRGSFEDLAGLLSRRSAERTPFWRELIEGGSERLQSRLRRFTTTASLSAEDLLTEADAAAAARNLARYDRFLSDESRAAGWKLLMARMKSDGNGQPVPERDPLAAALRAEHWSARVGCEEGSLRLSFRLGDSGGECEPDWRANGSDDSAVEIDVLNAFSTVPGGFAFANYQAALRDLSEAGVSGDLRLDQHAADARGEAGRSARGPTPREVVCRTVHFVFPPAAAAPRDLPTKVTP